MIWKAALLLIVLTHATIIAAVAAAMPSILLFSPWYLKVFSVLIVGRVLCGGVGVCPLNDVENAVRRRLGWPEIEGFLKFYIYGPFSRKAT